jgi:hypothetical protein
LDKRYQVFVSSTYADLQEERKKVIQTLMELDCIPSGMEIFPAVDEEQLEFIKKIIDDCDYYLLIIGGRYGTETPEGISYTEKEYDYAVEKGMKVIALLHKNPDLIASGKTDQNDSLKLKLKLFRDKVSVGRLVKYWSEAAELPGIVALSLSKTIKTHPAIGWVRGDTENSHKLLSEINILRIRNSELEKTNTEALKKNNSTIIPDLAPLTDTFLVKGYYCRNFSNYETYWEEVLTWEEIFALISPYLIGGVGDHRFKELLGTVIIESKRPSEFKSAKRISLDDQIYQTIKIHCAVLNLIELKGTFISLTQQGVHMMYKCRSVKA